MRQILGYFLRNPQTADSLEGVVRWRLQEERIRQRTQDAKYALDWLVEREFLQMIRSTVSGPIYRLNEEQRSAVEKFLDAGTTASRKKRSKRTG